MTFWQRFAVIVLGILAAFAVQLLVKDPDARVSLTGTCTFLIGWMMRTPGAESTQITIPPPARVPTFPETPESKDRP